MEAFQRPAQDGYVHTYFAEPRRRITVERAGVSAQTCCLIVGTARRRRDRRLRMHWRHEQLSLRMLLASVGHHSWQSRASVGVQTAPAPVAEHVAPAPMAKHTTPLPAAHAAAAVVVPDPYTQHLHPTFLCLPRPTPRPQRFHQWTNMWRRHNQQ